MALGYDDLPDFTTFKSRTQIERTLKKLWKPKQKPTNHSLAVWEFTNVLRPGDIVIPKEGTTKYLGYGIVRGQYARDDSRPHYKHVRPVQWVKSGSWKDSEIVQKTLTDITKYPDYVKRLRKLIGIGDAAPTATATDRGNHNVLVEHYTLRSAGHGQDIYNDRTRGRPR